MDLCAWVNPVVKIRSRILLALVGIETRRVHPPSSTLETNVDRYFGLEKEDQ